MKTLVLLFLLGLGGPEANEFRVDKYDEIRISLMDFHHSGNLFLVPFTLSVKGKRFIVPIDVQKQHVPIQSFYGTPIECTIGANKSFFTANREWYDALRAPGSMRTKTGEPLEAYMPTSDRIFTEMTYPGLPKIVAMRILAYLRIGPRHYVLGERDVCFEEGEIDTILSQELCEEFQSGKFRLVAENYATCEPRNECFYPIWETQKINTYLHKNPEVLVKITIEDFFGKNSPEFPVNLFFRGGTPDKIKNVLCDRKKIFVESLPELVNELCNNFKSLPDDDNVYKKSILRKNIVSRLTKSEENALDNVYPKFRKDLFPFQKVEYIIDLNDQWITFGYIKNSNKLSKKHLVWDVNGETLKIKPIGQLMQS